MADGDSASIHQVVAGEGAWAGWSMILGSDPFEDLAGPFYFRDEADGTRRAAFRVEAKHLNVAGGVHGGCLMTFADYALFMIAHRDLDDLAAVTVSLNGEFVGPAAAGDLIEAAGEVVRAGGSLVFVRGLITGGGAPMVSFSGVLKKPRRR
jgi:uncharacterized protein (TIGR00369 family)